MLLSPPATEEHFRLSAAVRALHGVRGVTRTLTSGDSIRHRTKPKSFSKKQLYNYTLIK